MAADIAASLGMIPQDSADADIEKHKQHCMQKARWRQDDRIQAFKIEGLALNVMEETLARVLADPWRSPNTGADMTKMVPVGRLLDLTDIHYDHMKFVIESYVSSGIPVLMQVDAKLSLASVIDSKHRRPHRPYTSQDEAQLARANELLADAMLGGVPPFPSTSGYHPAKDVHCVVLVGSRGLLGDETEAKVMYHCPLHGPYRESEFHSFYVAASLPFMKFVGPQSLYRWDYPCRPQLGWIAVVPEYIYFEPLSLFIQLRKLLRSTTRDPARMQLGKGMPAVTDDSIWRVRMIHESKIRDCYFRGCRLLDPHPMFRNAQGWRREDLGDFLPKHVDSTLVSQHVLCLELFASRQDAKRLKPSAVFFGYVSPSRQYPSGYNSPFTGGFCVEPTPAGARVAFFQVTPDGRFSLGGNSSAAQTIGSSLLLDDVVAHPIEPV